MNENKKDGYAVYDMTLPSNPPAGLNAYYFTFPKDSIHAKRYVKLYAESWEEAQNDMNCFYGNVWAFQYYDETWVNESGKTIAEIHNLSQTEIIEKNNI